MTKKIAIIVDNPKRDLRGLLLLSHTLAKYGARIFLVPMYQQGYDIPLLAPDLVIANYARENNRALLSTYQQLDYQIAILDTEGGILSEDGADSVNNWAQSINQSGLGKLIDYYCFWGSAVFEAFRKESGLDDSNLKVTGCPRYDLCSKPWSNVLSYKRKDFILVNTNFSAINPLFTQSADDEVKIFTQLGWDGHYVDSLFQSLKSVFPKYLDIIEHIARSYPERTIQIRPHPFENNRIYKERFTALENVIIDGDGDIFDAIGASSCVIHLNCGSSVDALRLGKLPISLEYLNNACMQNHAPLPSKLSLHATSTDHLINLLNDVQFTSKNFDFKKSLAEVERWFYVNDGKASSRIAEFLMSNLTKNKKIPTRGIIASILGGRKQPRLSQLVRGLIGIILGSKNASHLTERFLPNRKHKKIDIAFVEHLLTEFAALDDQKKPVVSFAKNPFSTLAMSTIEIKKERI